MQSPDEAAMVPSDRMRSLLAGALAGAALAACLARPAAAQFREIETRDLRLVYLGTPFEFIAPYTGRCFERSLRFYRDHLDYTPTERVNVYLEDTSDYGNAGVFGAPHSTMLVQVSPMNSVYETGPSNERMNFLMNHELAHVVTLDQAAGPDVFFRWLFHGKVRETNEHPESILYGYLTLPRRAAPRWHREGTAVFFETWMSGGLGRAQGPFDEMVFRAMVRDSAHFYDPLGLETEGVKVDFQVGVNSYLYGTRFMSYLAWQYSPQSLVRWVARTPGSRAYFASQFRQVYGKSLVDAWHDWIAWERDFQRANLDSVRRYPTTPSRDLSPYALGSVSRACLDSLRRTIYAGVYYPGALPYVAAIPLDGGPIRRLAEVKGPALYFVCSLAWDPDGRMLYYTTDNNDWRDLRSLDPATGRTRLLLKDARVGDLAFNRQDRTLWGIRHFNGIVSLVRFRPPYTDYQRVYSFPYGRDVYDIDISPDGTQLVASVAEISGRQTLRMMSIPALLAADSTSRQLYDFGVSIPNGFVFSPDGRALYGSSFYTGVSNLFRYDLVADSMDIVTNAETGFFRPLSLHDDSLVAFRYTGKGLVPAALEARPLHDVSAITFLGARLVDRYPELKSWKVPPPSSVNIDSLTTYAGSYRASANLGLANVYPIVEGYKAYTAAGLRFGIQDPFAFHELALTATASPSEALGADERWHLGLDWRHRFWSARYRYNRASFYDLFGPTKQSRKGQELGVGYSRLLVNDAPREVEFSADVAGYTALDRLPEYQNVATSPDFNQLYEAKAALRGKYLRSSLGSVDYEKGTQWSVSADQQLVRLESAGHGALRGFPQVVGTLDGGVPLGTGHSSFWLRTAAGYSPGDPNEPFSNFFFGAFGNNWLDVQDPKRYRTWSSLPGLEINQVGGTDFARIQGEWNLPGLRFERLGRLELFASWARLSLFSTALVTNLSRPRDRQVITDAGLQADVRFQLLLQQPLTLSFGLARAFDSGHAAGDEGMVSLKIL